MTREALAATLALNRLAWHGLWIDESASSSSQDLPLEVIATCSGTAAAACFAVTPTGCLAPRTWTICCFCRIAKGGSSQCCPPWCRQFDDDVRVDIRAPPPPPPPSENRSAMREGTARGQRLATWQRACSRAWRSLVAWGRHRRRHGGQQPADNTQVAACGFCSCVSVA